MMAIDNVISDETLLPLLASSKSTLAQALKTVDWLLAQTSDSTTLDQQLELSEQQKVLNAHLAKLRGQSRKAAFSVRDTKSETADARQEVDRLLLQLQNLYYEQRHLMGEISACEGYNHVYKQLPLIEPQEFRDLFPQHAQLIEEDLMAHRIEYEKQEREKMEDQRLKLVEAKELLLKDNTHKKEELKKMDEKLEAIIEGLVSTQGDLAKSL